MIRLQVLAEDYPGSTGWELVDWCVRRGADEFGLALLGPPYLPRTEWTRVDELLAPFRRRVASAGDCWMLNGETMLVLRDLLAKGPLVIPAADSPLQEFCVYRGAGVLLQVALREGTGVLRPRDDETASLDRAGLRYRAEPG